MDLVMLDHEGYLAFFERKLIGDNLMLLPGQRIFHGVNGSVFSSKNEVEEELPGVLRLNYREAGGSGRRKLCLLDWDNDGDLDLFIANGDGAHREMGHGGGPCMLHNPSYDFNDDLIPLGATFWVRLAEKWLGQPRTGGTV